MFGHGFPQSFNRAFAPADVGSLGDRDSGTPSTIDVCADASTRMGPVGWRSANSGVRHRDSCGDGWRVLAGEAATGNY